MVDEAGRLREAREVEEAVRSVYGVLRRPFDRDVIRSGLTMPQVWVMEELTREDGLSLKELSSRVSLSHSTVSGIVDRLQKRGFVGRTPNPQDRRYSVIRVTDEVSDYVSKMSPARSLGPIPAALARAGYEERREIVSGLRSLKRLLDEISAENEGVDR